MQASINQVSSGSIATPTLPNQTREEIIAERRANKAASKRIYWTEREHLKDVTWIAQPFEYGKPIGWAGYHWMENMRANDGDFYAVYGPNRGGDNRKYYNLVTEKWEDKYERPYTCVGCGDNVTAMRPGITKCPKCGTDREFKS